MRKETVIDALGKIDDDMIQDLDILRQKKRRTSRKHWAAMAACFCLLVAAAASLTRLRPQISPIPPESGELPMLDSPAPLLPHQPEKPVSEEPAPLLPQLPEAPQPTEKPETQWTLHFNEATAVCMANRANIKGVFTEPLNETELSAVIPNTELACIGFARFDDGGNLLEVVLQVETALPDSPITVGLADYYFGFDCVLPGEELVSVCHGVEYRACRYLAGNTVILSARALIDGICFGYSMEVPQDKLKQAEENFQYILECFANYGEGKPDLSVIAPEELPELKEQMFRTLSEAQTEPDFGRYMPSELPAGFGEAIIRRFKFQNSNYLSGTWTRGMDNLTWVVDPYTEEDAHRLTSVEDKKNYDLSRYPIPRADSVPDELREIVNDPIFEAEELTLEAVYCRAYKVSDAGDTDGWRMRFSVRFGDVIVSVSTKGVEPEWLYQQLFHLRSE